MRGRKDNCDTRTKFKSNVFNVKKMYSDEKLFTLINALQQRLDKLMA